MPPHLKKSINQAYLENGSNDQIVKHLEREMELNGLEADEPLVKTLITVIKKDQKTEKSNKKQTEKPKTQTPITVPDKKLKNDQCRYCKETGHMMADCPNWQNDESLKKTQRLTNARTVIHLGIKKKTATLVLTWKTAHPSGP